MQKHITAVNTMVEEMTGLNFSWEEQLDNYANYIPDLKPRDVEPTTRALAAAVQSARSAGREPRRGRIHPATRVFQALRVAVNRELENLEAFLEQVVAHLRPGGKLAVISFHSLEDGMVKRFLRQAKAAGTMEELTRRPVVADPEERKRNRRSRSAKLRVGRRLEAEPKQGG